MMSCKIHLNVSNIGNDDNNIDKDEITGIVGIISAGYYNIEIAYRDACMKHSFPLMNNNDKILSYKQTYVVQDPN